MTLAILRTGEPPGDLLRRFGHYDAMFAGLLGMDTVGYDVTAGEYPAAPEAHAAYLVTGSPAGVYDPLPWIAPLQDFLRRAKGKTKLVGICFGHQVMAEAFGGHVEKSVRGWGAGLQDHDIVVRAPWMDDVASIAVPVSHQDQIVVQPPHSHILARSDFSPFGMLAYDDQPAISMQFHPEFAPDYAKALIEVRRERLPDPDGAFASLDRPNDRARVGKWIRRFLASPS
ncbi:MAG TPA: type 1 glutamine amidotransferase [Allosphingosinicella sp.]|jgi:GMP synthase-like glutamine amidotransferase